MKFSFFTVLFLLGFFPQVFLGQNVAIVVGRKVEFGNRQPLSPPDLGLPATPLVSLSSPALGVGISSQGRAGITSNVELPGGVTSTLTPPAMVYQNATIWNVPEPGAAEAAAAVEGPQEETSPLDMGSSFFAAMEAPKEPGISLGEVAARYKAMDRPGSVRIYTNSDGW